MKLPLPELSVQQRLSEFDIWITPTLGDVRDTLRFAEELERVAAVFNRVAQATNGFESLEACRPAAIAETYLDLVDDDPTAETLLYDLASTLFMVTGKSDNNAKCQLPLYFRDQARIDSFPAVARGRVRERTLPRVLKSDKLMKSVANSRISRHRRGSLLEAFVGYVLSDEQYAKQLFSVGRSYVAMQALGFERDLLSPLITFQVRGSVAASGGHDPEDLLREMMESWGLRAETHFNTSDVVVVQEPPTDRRGARTKTRAYDFVLPYGLDTIPWSLFIQCQFYAGDSGSVSHKNVDQTRSSRDKIRPLHANARFIEYVDGAGYFASLNTDLQSLLSMPDTASFIQIRSAPIRLRRELQALGLVSPIDITHAILCGYSNSESVGAHLEGDGYTVDAIRSGLRLAMQMGFIAISPDGNHLVRPEHSDLARRLLLLDLAAITGEAVFPRNGNGKAMFLVPGHGPFHGLKIDELIRTAMATAPGLRQFWGRSPDLTLADLRWLDESGFGMLT